MTKKFKLLKDLPASKAGEIFTNKERGYYYSEKYVVGRDSIDTGEAFLPKYVEYNPTWFAPIEEPKEEQPFQVMWSDEEIIAFRYKGESFEFKKSDNRQQTNTIPSGEKYKQWDIPMNATIIKSQPKTERTYTEKELREAEEKAFNAGRAMDVTNPIGYISFYNGSHSLYTTPKYLTYLDYKNKTHEQ